MVPLGGDPHTPWGGGGELPLSGCQFLNGPILEKSHTIARDATKSYVTETKMELQELVPLGGHPPHPPGGELLLGFNF